MDRLQISEAERTQGGFAKVDPRLRFAGHLMLPDARQFQLSLACPNYAGFALIRGGNEVDFSPM